VHASSQSTHAAARAACSHRGAAQGMPVHASSQGTRAAAGAAHSKVQWPSRGVLSRAGQSTLQYDHDIVAASRPVGSGRNPARCLIAHPMRPPVTHLVSTHCSDPVKHLGHAALDPAINSKQTGSDAIVRGTWRQRWHHRPTGVTHQQYHQLPTQSAAISKNVKSLMPAASPVSNRATRL